MRRLWNESRSVYCQICRPDEAQWVSALSCGDISYNNLTHLYNSNSNHYLEGCYKDCTERAMNEYGEMEADWLPTAFASPLKSAGGRQFSRLLAAEVCGISGSNAGYTMFRGSVKGTGYPLHSPISPSLPLPCATVCHHISTGVYQQQCIHFGGKFNSESLLPCQVLLATYRNVHNTYDSYL